MKVKVTLKEIVIDQEDIAIQESDLKIEDTRIILSYGFFVELEEIFKNIRKGCEAFKGSFEFRTTK